jgi:hypothetical protein
MHVVLFPQYVNVKENDVMYIYIFIEKSGKCVCFFTLFYHDHKALYYMNYVRATPCFLCLCSICWFLRHFRVKVGS